MNLKSLLFQTQFLWTAIIKWTIVKQFTGQPKKNTKLVIALHLQNFYRALRYFYLLEFIRM